MLGQYHLFYYKACLLFIFLFFLKKEGWYEGCRALLFHYMSFQISYVCLIDVLVSNAIIHLPLYN